MLEDQRWFIHRPPVLDERWESFEDLFVGLAVMDTYSIEGVR